MKALIEKPLAMSQELWDDNDVLRESIRDLNKEEIKELIDNLISDYDYLDQAQAIVYLMERTKYFTMDVTFYGLDKLIKQYQNG